VSVGSANVTRGYKVMAVAAVACAYRLHDEEIDSTSMWWLLFVALWISAKRRFERVLGRRRKL
jgi:hypothetical protein